MDYWVIKSLQTGDYVQYIYRGEKNYPHKYTVDPLKAVRFPSKMRAQRYITKTDVPVHVASCFQERMAR